MKKFIKLNDNDEHLSFGNLCRIIKSNSVNKTAALQVELFCSIFNIDFINDTTVNNYCVGCRSINDTYKQIFISYKKKYNNDKNILVDNIVNLLSIIEGNIYSFDNINDSLNFINRNKNLYSIVNKLYNISKNDKDVDNSFSNSLLEYINNNNLYEAICSILFYVILEKKQPIYVDDLKKTVIENILSNTDISLTDLEEYLNLKFVEGINFNYLLKKQALDGNAYACFEMGMNEYKGYVAGTPRYDVSYDYFYKASLANHPSAYYMMGHLYINGYLGSMNHNELDMAYKYVLKAKDLGSIAAINTLGVMYLRGIYPLKYDINKAIKCFNEASKSNYAYAFNNLGSIYEGKKEYDKAFEYYLISANLGESWACNKIGEFYRKGIATNVDLMAAFKYYSLAIDVEFYSCCFYSYYNLAKYFYLNGCPEANVTADKNKAISFLEIASKNNVIDASILLIYVYVDEYLISKDELLLNKIKYYVAIVEKSSLYDDDLRKEIESNLNKIKNHKRIDLNIII